jgi:hypothetical protein
MDSGSRRSRVRDQQTLKGIGSACRLWIPDQVGNDGLKKRRHPGTTPFSPSSRSTPQCRHPGSGEAPPVRHPGSGEAPPVRHPGSGEAAIRDPQTLKGIGNACRLWIPDQVGNDGLEKRCHHGSLSFSPSAPNTSV